MTWIFTPPEIWQPELFYFKGFVCQKIGTWANEYYSEHLIGRLWIPYKFTDLDNFPDILQPYVIFSNSIEGIKNESGFNLELGDMLIREDENVEFCARP